MCCTHNVIRKYYVPIAAAAVGACVKHVFKISDNFKWLTVTALIGKGPRYIRLGIYVQVLSKQILLINKC